MNLNNQIRSLVSLVPPAGALLILCSTLTAAPENTQGPTKPGTASSINEIVLEDWPGFVARPQRNKIVLRSDGTCWRLTGGFGSPRRLKGSLSSEKFSRLAKYFVEAGFFSMEPRYAPNPAMTDMPTTVLTLTRAKTKKEVQDYAHAAPEKLWKLELLVRGAAEEIYWQDVTPPAATTPTPTPAPKIIRPSASGSPSSPRILHQ